MGTLIGHVAPGLGFFFIGIWHLFSHTKLHALNPKSYTSRAWFPVTRLRYLELYLIIVGASLSVAMELFIGPDRHQPLDPDGTIPSNHLHNFEHSSISATFLAYAALSVALDRFHPPPPAAYGLSQLLGAAAFGQQLFLFHLHSADHMGVEGQYHLLLQIAIFVSLITTLIGISCRRSFLVSFVRSLSVLFQGIWLMTMGFALWTPDLVPKGCFIHSEEGHQVVRCGGDAALHRARSLVNILFSWFFIVLIVFAVFFYLVILRSYGEKLQYESLTAASEDGGDGDSDGGDGDVESQKKRGLSGINSFIHMGKGFAPIDMER